MDVNSFKLNHWVYFTYELFSIFELNELYAFPKLLENFPRIRKIKNDSCIDYEDRLTACRWRNEISRSKSALESHLSIDEEVKDESLPRTRSTADVKRFPRIV